jgi:structure-specific recognition protein 1
MEKGFVFVHKPPMYIRFNEIDHVYFARSGGATRNFDFEVMTNEDKKIAFSNITKVEQEKLLEFCEKNRLDVRNASEPSTRKAAPKDGSSSEEEEADDDDNDPAWGE